MIDSNTIPSYLHADHLGPWETYLTQVERVAPYIEPRLQPWIETLRRPKRILIVDIPIKLENGTIALSGKIGRGRKATKVNYAITANGAVLSNEFVARRVTNYREGLAAVQELVSKRLS